MDNQGIKEKHKKSILMRRIGGAICILTFIGMILFERFHTPPQNPFANDIAFVIALVIAAASVLIGAALIILYWRCPQCKKTLPGGSASKIAQCPYCGADLL